MTQAPVGTRDLDASTLSNVRPIRFACRATHGEEELGFTSFRSIPRGRSSYSAYSAGAQSARVGQQSVWQRVGTHHVPAALPPARRPGA
ncbi:hypothetical protein [Streptomyces sp. DHE17-7]|uniref:hypothetical protein n=1 Tax=Streptomyces sp. DHE17-7 TaxID=2759949 RepID=UPI003FA7BC62